MDTVLSLLAFAAIVAVVMFIQKAFGKGVGAASAALNQKVLFKSEHEEDARLVQPYTFETTASMGQIKQAVSEQVGPAKGSVGVAAAIHELSSTDDEIVYAFASSLTGAMFTVALTVNDQITPTKGVFCVVNYKEKDGLLVGRDRLRELRKQIREALKTVDQTVSIVVGAAGVEVEYETVRG